MHGFAARDLRDDHVDVTDYTQASDVTISETHRTYNRGYLNTVSRYGNSWPDDVSLRIGEVVQMNLRKIIMVIFVIYDQLDSYPEDQGCNWFSGS